MTDLEYRDGAMRPRGKILHMSEYRQPHGVISRLPTGYEREQRRSPSDRIALATIAAVALFWLLYAVLP